MFPILPQYYEGVFRHPLVKESEVPTELNWIQEKIVFFVPLLLNHV